MKDNRKICWAELLAGIARNLDPLIDTPCHSPVQIGFYESDY